MLPSTLAAVVNAPPPSRKRRRWLVPLAAAAFAFDAWAVAALGIDASGAWRVAGPAIFVASLVFGCWRFRGLGARVAVLAAAPLAVLAWWLSLVPSNERAWQKDVARTAWAELDGDRVTLHDTRACTYRSDVDLDCEWPTRTVFLSRLTGLDLFVNYWGSPDLAHPILSFTFEGDEPVALSIETRKELGEGYSAVRGFFRTYELIALVSTERDLVAVRTSYRKGEDVYLFHTTATPTLARRLFVAALSRVNALHERPEWYNALTSNCTTNPEDLLERVQPGSLPAWDARKLLNGTADRMLWERGALAGDLPFDELKRSARVNEAAMGHEREADFSERLRAGRPGFSRPTSASTGAK